MISKKSLRFIRPLKHIGSYYIRKFETVEQSEQCFINNLITPFLLKMEK